MMFTGSKKELLNILKREGTVSIDEAVEKMELAKTTLREHLLQLERDGYIEREYLRSGPGRPRLQYQLTQLGDNLFPSYESSLIRELIEYLKKRGDERTVELFFKSFWNERFEKASKRMDEASGEDKELRMKALEEMLEEEGFMPEFDLDMEEESLEIKACNCPFSEVVKETRLPCKLEAMFYKKLFNGKAERTSHIGSGDYSCNYDISL